MPYIKIRRRKKLQRTLGYLCQALRALPVQAGEHFGKGDLNYCITQLVLAYVEHHGKRYDTLSDVTGVLNDVKVEFERRVVAPYEDKKIEENGDVYDD